ncbi:hypothetical protein SI65_03634 [Aspergillus cristatus]|uniref:Protein-S-isoprenylcysteine O-methyltransferase n=1 Tax=Aspergillus cristatus TaxID=573508 RepID=A0A1E3BIF9_ASPCR|nr:hypothetical protein SI65_03634 [Aspergillus cristatus]
MTINASSSSQVHQDSEFPAWRPPHPANSSSSSRSSSASPTPSATTARKAKPSPPLDPSNYPNGEKSLSGISLRAFLIGTTLGISTCVTFFFTFLQSTPLWRVPFFLASLSLFHFLEFYVTATYNTRYASVSTFLLSSNGWAYNVAHGSAMLECFIGYYFFPESHYYSLNIDASGVKITLALGLFLMALGQVVRTLAMAQAGSNFNHTVQVEHKEGHVLVRNGVYALSRHPSYFGFFWWGLGTQLVLGNVVCFVGYAVVLWRFFSSRIKREEKFLVCFFGDDYVDYKKTTWVGIPGIQ